MALAPYWLMPTLWPFPVPVMVMPSREAEPRPPEPPVRSVVPEDEMAVWSSPSRRLTVPPPEMTDAPSRRDRVFRGAVHRVAAAAARAAGDGEPQAGDVLAQGGAVEGHPGVVAGAVRVLPRLSTKVTEYTLPRSVYSDT